MMSKKARIYNKQEYVLYNSRRTNFGFKMLEVKLTICAFINTYVIIKKKKKRSICRGSPSQIEARFLKSRNTEKGGMMISMPMTSLSFWPGVSSLYILEDGQILNAQKVFMLGWVETF